MLSEDEFRLQSQFFVTLNRAYGYWLIRDKRLGNVWRQLLQVQLMLKQINKNRHLPTFPVDGVKYYSKWKRSFSSVEQVRLIRAMNQFFDEGEVAYKNCDIQKARECLKRRWTYLCKMAEGEGLLIPPAPEEPEYYFAKVEDSDDGDELAGVPRKPIFPLNGGEIMLNEPDL